MDFNFKNIVKDAGTAISRVVQFTEEKLGKAEKTELDAHFENLWERAENTRKFTEKIVKNAEAVLVPNPGNRIEDYVFEKIERQKPSRLSNLEYLGQDMVEAGTCLGPGTPYGSALIKVGQWEQKLGQTERDFIGSAGMCFTQPLRKFLDTEMKTIVKEQGVLEMKRLDLDACKNKVRKARGMLGQQTAERDLRIAQSEFDRQTEITKLLLEGIGSSQAVHLRCLYEFVETQARFYSQCTTVMTDLQRELASLASSSGPHSPTHTLSDDSTSVQTEKNTKRAKVLYDYTGKDSTELSVKINDVISITEISDDDYVMGFKGNSSGKVPKVFLEFLT
ncbi:endophilin-B1 isoform X2 [Anthonomus grandis grandis]|uniref:endophilin-B1 isoform X2 n=1 Tax=Anthonomus grandis grandis TaxID=2921223 RepID=UPI0021650084|nr:endophilin-B1 isoform X2 [Anthonomus grandis grandis]